MSVKAQYWLNKYVKHLIRPAKEQNQSFRNTFIRALHSNLSRWHLRCVRDHLTTTDNASYSVYNLPHPSSPFYPYIKIFSFFYTPTHLFDCMAYIQLKCNNKKNRTNEKKIKNQQTPTHPKIKLCQFILVLKSGLLNI